MSSQQGEPAQPPLSEVVREAVASSTAHAISRVAPADSDPKLRLLWLLIFLSFLGIVLYSSRTYINLLREPPVKSLLEADAVDFEFPDLYFCNSLQAAGMFTYLLNKTEADAVTLPLLAAQAVFNETLKLMNATEEELIVLRKLQPLSSIQSLPYSVLADIVGQRRLQTFYVNYGIFSVGSPQSLDTPVKIETMYHPDHLKCFKIALTDRELVEMSNTNNRMQFVMMLDPYFITLESLGLLSPQENHIPTMYASHLNRLTPIYSYDWNLQDPLEIDRGSGMQLYLTPRGQYPSALTTNVVTLGPGRAYDIAVRMSDSQRTTADFPGQCVAQQEAQPVLFFNPYSGSADSFSYSEAFCYYSEMARAAQALFNCSPTSRPLPWQFRHLRLCLNLTAADSGDARARNLRAAIVSASQAAANNQSSWGEACANMRPCRRRQYQVTSSFGIWPNQASLIRLVTNLLASILKSANPAEFRSMVTGITAMNRMKSAEDEVIHFEAQSLLYFERGAVKVTIRADSSRSPLTTFRLDYSLSQFVANMGGALGLYLGCSLLTVLELVELLHRVLAALWAKSSCGSES